MTGPIKQTRRGSPYRGDPCLELVNAVAEAGRVLIAARRAGLPTRDLVRKYHEARLRAVRCLGPSSPSRWPR